MTYRIEKFNELLSEWLKESKLTKTWVAEKLGITKQALDIWLRGKQPPPLRQIMAVQELTGIKFLYRDNRKEEKKDEEIYNQTEE